MHFYKYAASGRLIPSLVRADEIPAKLTWKLVQNGARKARQSGRENVVTGHFSEGDIGRLFLALLMLLS
jgi:hypothetical protein